MEPVRRLKCCELPDSNCVYWWVKASFKSSDMLKTWSNSKLTQGGLGEKNTIVNEAAAGFYKEIINSFEAPYPCSTDTTLWCLELSIVYGTWEGCINWRHGLAGGIYNALIRGGEGREYFVFVVDMDPLLWYGEHFDNKFRYNFKNQFNFWNEMLVNPGGDGYEPGRS